MALTESDIPKRGFPTDWQKYHAYLGWRALIYAMEAKYLGLNGPKVNELRWRIPDDVWVNVVEEYEKWRRCKG